MEKVSRLVKIISAAIYAYNKLTNIPPSNSYIIASILYLNGVRMNYFVDKHGINSELIKYYYHYRSSTLLEFLKTEEVKEIGEKFYTKLRDILKSYGVLQGGLVKFSRIDRIIMREALRVYRSHSRRICNF